MARKSPVATADLPLSSAAAAASAAAPADAPASDAVPPPQAGQPAAAKPPVKRAKPAARKASPAASKPKPVKPAKAVKPPQPAKPKPAAKPPAGAQPTVVDKPAGKLPRPHPKLVRDSFTMPEADFAYIARLKVSALGVGRAAKKSELLRAGLRLLATLDAKTLVQVLDDLTPVKTGRPKKGR